MDNSLFANRDTLTASDLHGEVIPIIGYKSIDIHHQTASDRREEFDNATISQGRIVCGKDVGAMKHERAELTPQFGLSDRSATSRDDTLEGIHTSTIHAPGGFRTPGLRVRSAALFR